MSENRRENRLNTLLRAGDPAAGDPGMDARERALMRQRILAAGREARQLPASWLLPAAAAMALLALALGLALRRPPEPTRPLLASGQATGPRTAVAGAAAGQPVQFTTENGTLVVWVLQPRPTS